LLTALPDFGLKLDFAPTEFTQVNHAVNRVLVSRAIRLLDPQPGERVADMFCGLGNFSLPIARRGADVTVGVEGSEALVRARPRTPPRTDFQDALDSRSPTCSRSRPKTWRAKLGAFDKMLIDPPRDGAIDAGEGAGACARRHGAVKYRLCVVQSGHAGARPRGAGA
jgi:23S rRNA (uracil1939-C5)-methyltransferase